MLTKGVTVIGSRVTSASLRIAQVGGRRRVGIGIPAHGRNTGRCARRVATTFCPNTFLDSSNQSEIRNEIGCYRLPQPPLVNRTRAYRIPINYVHGPRNTAYTPKQSEAEGASAQRVLKRAKRECVEAYIGFYPPLHSAPTSEVPR